MALCLQERRHVALCLQESREARELARGCQFLRLLAAGAPQAHRNTWHNVFDSAPSSPKILAWELTA